jgi:formamidopyrimidine-DNA glycosylase
MPELPEVETTRRGIAPHVERQKVTAVRIYDRRLRWPVPRDLPRRLVGRVVDRVDRRSKYLLFRLGGDTLIVHFGMTGSLRVYGVAPARRTHDHIDLEFANGVILRYHDPRRFGAMLWSPAAAGEHPLLAALGPEPLEDAFDGLHLWKMSRRRAAPVKIFLMDQKVVVGVGNIYASEALFAARIRPTRAAGSLSRAGYATLAGEIRRILAAAIARGGTTLRDFLRPDGEPGYFEQELFAYGRQGEPCKICDTPIRAIVLGQRSTFYCPRCQR